jgi:hypothetical protein
MLRLNDYGLGQCVGVVLLSLEHCLILFHQLLG